MGLRMILGNLWKKSKRKIIDLCENKMFSQEEYEEDTDQWR